MTTEVMLRDMRWWDIPAVHAIETSSFTADAWSVAQFWSELAEPTRWYVCAQLAEDIVGYAGLFVLPPDADVQTIAVGTQARGRGVGQLLLTALIERARDLGCRSLLLEVRVDNSAALRLYRSAGFVEMSRRARYYADGSDALVMSRDLTQAAP